MTGIEERIAKLWQLLREHSFYIVDGYGEDATEEADVFLEVVKAQGTLDDALKAVGDLYEVEHDRAVIAGLL